MCVFSCLSVRQEAFIYQLVKIQPAQLTVQAVVKGTVLFRGRACIVRCAFEFPGSERADRNANA